jgi:DNA-binding ferritin-like protein (Dps family)
MNTTRCEYNEIREAIKKILNDSSEPFNARIDIMVQLALDLKEQASIDFLDVDEAWGKGVGKAIKALKEVREQSAKW